MQEQLKERLTGAALLVVVVVLAVPEMFRGQGSASAPAAAPLPAEPLQTVPLTSQPAVAPGPGTPADSDAAPAADSAPLAPLGGTPPLPAAGQGAPAPAATQATGPAPVATPAPAAAASPPQPREAKPEPGPPIAEHVVSPAPRAAAPQHAAGARKGGGWAVQLGSFHRKDLAERMAREARGKGLKVHVVGPDDRGLFRVRSAILADKPAALEARAEMAAKGYKPIINASP